MRTHDEEMTGLTHKMDCECERISLEDIALTGYLLDELLAITGCRTYDLFIASDMLTDSEETLS